MGIEQGLVMLVQSDAAVKALCPVGGFFVQLPKDAALPSWAYIQVSEIPNYTLTRISKPLVMLRLQIDCFGTADARGADVIALDTAIFNVLSGYQGTLSDPDATYVDSCFLSDSPSDEFNEAARNYVRRSEYEVFYAQS